MDCSVHAVTKSRTRLSDFHFTSLHFWVCVLVEQGRVAINLVSLYQEHSLLFVYQTTVWEFSRSKGQLRGTERLKRAHQ